MKATSAPAETVLVPIAGLVSMPSPSRQETVELIASLQQESARVASGEYTLFEKEAFLADLRNECRDHQPSKSTR
jgi:hypothetical protein